MSFWRIFKIFFSWDMILFFFFSMRHDLIFFFWCSSFHRLSLLWRIFKLFFFFSLRHMILFLILIISQITLVLRISEIIFFLSQRHILFFFRYSSFHRSSHPCSFFIFHRFTQLNHVIFLVRLVLWPFKKKTK